MCHGIMLCVVDPSFILGRLNRAVRKAQSPKGGVQSGVIVLCENEIPLLDTAVYQTSSDVCCDLIYGAPYYGTELPESSRECRRCWDCDRTGGR
jgi:hypothetical protein